MCFRGQRTDLASRFACFSVGPMDQTQVIRLAWQTLPAEPSGWLAFKLSNNSLLPRYWVELGECEIEKVKSVSLHSKNSPKFLLWFEGRVLLRREIM